MKSNTRLKQKLIRKPFQEIQDDIFRKMSADRKMEISSQLWRLAKDLAGGKINYIKKVKNGKGRSSAFAGKNFKTS